MVKKWFDILLKLRKYGNTYVFTVDKDFVEHHKLLEGNTFTGKICFDNDNINCDIKNKGDSDEPINQ